MKKAYLLLLLVSSSLFGQNIDGNLKKKLDEISARDVPKNAPGIATGIVQNGKIVYQNFAGYADLTDSVLIGKNSRFNIASNGKQFTALAVLKLIEEGKLTLGTSLGEFFPGLAPKIGEQVQIQHLLNHSSGIRDVYNLWSLQGITWWKQTFNNTDAFNLLLKQRELNFEPGSSYSYSNSNYILLALLVEKVTGESFVNYTNRMFQELGMPNTSFVTDHKNISGEIAKPYFNFNTWKGYKWLCDMHGDGNLFSTLTDQLHWEQIVQTGESSFLSKEIIAKSQQHIEYTEIENYGYGLTFGKHKGIPYKYHEGSTGAWKAISVRFPEQKMSIVTLTNSGKVTPTQQTLDMADVLLKIDTEKAEFPIKPESIGAKVEINEVLGTYLTDNNYYFQFEEREGDLYLLRSGRNDMKLVREADNIFHQWNDDAFKQEFTQNDKGEMQVTAYYPTVPPFTLTRSESDWRNYNYIALNGIYQNSETDVSINIKHIADKQYEVKRGKRTFTATLIKPDELLVNDYVVKIDRDINDKVTQLFLTSGRIQEIRFERE